VPGLPRSRHSRLTRGVAARPSLLAAAVATLGALVFAPAIMGGFIYDDRPLIADNLYVHSFDAWQRWLTHDFWDVNEEVKHFATRMMYWRPGVTASYAVDWQLGGGSPIVFHAENLAWHAVASFLSFVVLRRWIGATLPAFFAALIFAVHPTKAESVAWIAGRTDVLCAVAMLVASEGIARRLAGRRGGLALEVLCTAFAYAMKEQAVVLFAFAAVETWAFAGRPALESPVLRRIARGAAPQLAVALAYVGARAILLPVRPPHEATLGFGPHTFEVLETMGRFAALTFAPHDLSVQQGLIRAPGGQMAFDVLYVPLGAAFVMALALGVFLMRKEIPGVAVGIAFFAVTLFPTSNVVTTDLMMMLSERFLYVPLLGFALAAGTLGAAIVRADERRTAVVFVGACLAIVALGTLSSRHAADFRDEKRFWARELSLHPESLEALRFHIQRETEQKHFAKALEFVARAEKIAASDYPQTGFELDFIVQGVELSVAAAPDHDTKALVAADDFLATLARGEAGVAALETRALAVRLPLGGATLAKRIDKKKPQVVALRASIKSRLADDRTAFQLAGAALAQCPGCLDVGRAAALVSARAGRYDEAGRILDDVARFTGEAPLAPTRSALGAAERAAGEADASDDPAAKLQFHATAFCALEAWGRAFDVLAPARSEIEKAPGFAMGFAELAWRAGEFDVARQVLARWMPRDAAEKTTRTWSMKMGWIEEKAQPVPL
jgi:hypothetical protein